MNSPHIPVLLDACLDGLNIQPDDKVLDGTLGFGGHSQKILEKLGPEGRLIGIDQDPHAIAYCKAHLKHPNIQFAQQNYSEFPAILESLGIKKISKALFDLGFSSLQLDSPSRGFSFLQDAPLDMRMDPNAPLTASEILKTYSKDALSDLFFHYGELFQNKRLVENIVKNRAQLSTTTDLITIVKKSYFFENKRNLLMKTLSQVFQALRMEVNQELPHLEKTLNHLLTHLEPGGIVAIISFHSIEDRLVKNFIRNHKTHLKAINKKVITASEAELAQNSRAKPAKLRLFSAI